MGERAQHSIAQAAFGPVIFNGDKLLARFLRGSKERLFIDGFDRVGIDHANGDALVLEPVIRLQCLVYSDAYGNDSDLGSARLAHKLATANRELFVWAV